MNGVVSPAPDPAREPAQTWLAYVRAHGQPCFVGWPDAIALAWFRFHAEHRTIAVITDAARIVGLGVAWQARERDLETHWHVSDPAGDCLYIAHFIAATAPARRALVAALCERFPAWRALRLFARRGPKGLQPLSARFVERFYRRT